MPRGSGRRLTYRERWERLRAWVSDPDGLPLEARTRWYWARDEDSLSVAQVAIRLKIDALDHMTLVKARPVRCRLTRTRKRARL
jgi:hypothetical protein